MWGSSTADAEGDGGLRVPVAAECAAAQSFLPRLVPQSSLLAANARLDQSSSVAQTFGPVIAGALVTALGAPLAVLLDALSYLASGAAVASIRPSEVTTATRDQSLGLRREIGEGLSWVYRHHREDPRGHRAGPEGEQMRTEISAKFRLDRVRDELAVAGLITVHSWTDPVGDFALTLAGLGR